jgi:hypothetical protein
MTNARADHYRRQANECRAQAERSRYIDHKESWLKLAVQWLHMAEEIELSPQAQQAQSNERPPYSN